MPKFCKRTYRDRDTEEVEKPRKRYLPQARRRIGLYERAHLRFCNRTQRLNTSPNGILLYELEHCHEDEQLSNHMGHLFMELVGIMLNKQRFQRLVDPEDMAGLALCNLSRTWGSFDATRSDNPYGYFVQIIKSSFIQHASQERRHETIKANMEARL